MMTNWTSYGWVDDSMRRLQEGKRGRFHKAATDEDAVQR